jgi:hypothetical protein
MSPWKKNENARHEREYNFFMDCFETVKEAHSKGESKPSYTEMFLEEQEKSGVREEEGQYVVGVAIAGALTIGSPMQSYILAMCQYPQWQGGKCVRRCSRSAVTNVPCGRTEHSCQRSELW